MTISGRAAQRQNTLRTDGYQAANELRLKKWPALRGECLGGHSRGPTHVVRGGSLFFEQPYPGRNSGALSEEWNHVGRFQRAPVPRVFSRKRFVLFLIYSGTAALTPGISSTRPSLWPSIGINLVWVQLADDLKDPPTFFLLTPEGLRHSKGKSQQVSIPRSSAKASGWTPSVPHPIEARRHNNS